MVTACAPSAAAKLAPENWRVEAGGAGPVSPSV
jgi:hypothetical protein